MISAQFRSLTVSLPLLLLCLIISPVAAQNPFGAIVRETEPLTPEEELKTLHVPDGFRVQLFAAEPMIQKPMNLAFDSRGRLWMSGSNDYPIPAEEGKSTDSIRILEDTDGDGAADRVTTFVENITIPIGLYPYKNGVIAFTIPNIWYYEDTDGDGKSDKQTLLYGAFDYSRDTHGMCNAFRRGYDGWIYACHGFNNQSVVKGRDGHTVEMASGNTFRFRVDGERIEHFTWGQVNPFGMTFDRFGDLYNSDCHTVPITLLLRGSYNQSFGKPHDGLGFCPPVMTHSHGSTAIAGVTQYTGNVFPVEYQNSLFVGNVMSCRIHRDVLKSDGSSVSVVEQPDFLTCDDPWFRPVDLQSGPDGALYIADFYNRIIGHYEVKLDHPDRDRSRARIWRVSYVGTEDEKTESPKDLTQATVAELIREFDHLNLPQRMRATDEISDRIGIAAVPELEAALDGQVSSLQRVHLLWSLKRLNSLSNERLIAAAGSDDALVRIHAMRILSETPNWSDTLLAAAIDGLKDSDAMVRRAAADAAAQQPQPKLVEPVLSQLLSAPESDKHLRHSLLIALRNQLRVEGAFKHLREAKLSESQMQLVATAALGVNSREAAAWLLYAVETIAIDPDRMNEVLKATASNASLEDAERLARVVRKQLRGDIDLQLSLLKSVRDGLRQQGLGESSELSDWATELAGLLLKSNDEDSLAWGNIPHPDTKDNPWALEKRHSADGKRDVLFMSSLPGGEHARATLRSKSFEIPERLKFFICGHLGYPDKPAVNENFVRLRLADSHEEIVRALPPRNDTAQQVDWDLKQQAGKQGYLEIVDGIDLGGYAWLAVSRFSPPVVPILEISPQVVAERLKSAAGIAEEFGLRDLEPLLTELASGEYVDIAARAAAARTLASFHPDARTNAIAELVADPGLSEAVRSSLCDLIVHHASTPVTDAAFGEVLKTLPARLLIAVSEKLADERSGAALLLDLMDQGTVSPRLLRSATLREKLVSSRGPGIEERIAKMMEALPEPKEELAQLIAARVKQYAKADVSPQRGRAVFEKTCAVCHVLQGRGRVVGPQLEGIGNRGLERVIEDILDPNRNVDVAFHSRTYTLFSGKVISGLFRRVEGETVIVADNKGKELTIPKADIEEEAVSKLSVMPDNWGTIIPEPEFNDLVSYLLSQQQKKPTDVEWKVTQIDPRFRSEGVALADVNHDGKPDVLAGEFWYEAPDWTRHEITKPGDYGDGAHGYSNCFECWADDINKDGWLDFVVVGFPGAPCYWYANPQNKPGHWQRHEIWHSACNETPIYTDLFGDGQRVLVMGWQPEGQNNQGQMAWFAPGDDPTAKWKMHAISRPSAPGEEVPGTQRFSHGLGNGDVNGDGRADVIVTAGWWEQPANAKTGSTPWQFHPAALGPASANMHMLDINGDGRADVLASSAHGFGIWWYEQGQDGELFQQRTLFADLVSQTHGMNVADINGDGLPDFITGKRWWAHGPGGDPGSDQPAVIYWFESVKNENGSLEFIPRLIDAASGIATQFEVGNVNNDDLLDIAVSSKSGVFIFEQSRRSSNRLTVTVPGKQ
jgi:putative heme-binding domain-containing protein